MTRPVHALALALGVTPAAPDTVDAAEAAVLLRTTVQGIYHMRSRGQLPRPLKTRPLVWSRADLLAGASGRKRGA